MTTLIEETTNLGLVRRWLTFRYDFYINVNDKRSAKVMKDEIYYLDIIVKSLNEDNTK